MNKPVSVNDPYNGYRLERQLAAKLEEILNGIDWMSGATVDAATERVKAWDLMARLPLPLGGDAHLLVECRSEIRPSQFSSLAARPCPSSLGIQEVVPLLAVPYVSPRLAAVCREHGWGWYDLAGNCFIDVPGLLRIERTGNPPISRPPRPTANLSSAESARVVRALLAPEQAGRIWTQRSLQEECEPAVSLGLVNKLVRHLRDEAFVEQTSERGFRVRDPEAAIAAWSAAYRFDRHRREGYFTILQGRKLGEALRRLEAGAAGRVCYAAFSAAEIQAPHVRQPRTWLYVADEAEGAFRAALEAKPVDSGANLVLLFPDDAGVFYRLERGPDRLPATNPVQTYVDLLHSGGRGEEAAEALLEQRLRPAWKGEPV
jgi:hypothetical protein